MNDADKIREFLRERDAQDGYRPPWESHAPLLLRLHWWCMRKAAQYDRPGYSVRSFAFDWIGGRVAEIYVAVRAMKPKRRSRSAR